MKKFNLALILMALFISGNAFALTEVIGGLAQPTEVKEDSTTHDSLVIVIDGSSSMLDPIQSDSNVIKIDAAKAALKSVINQIPVTTQFGVMLFVNAKIEWLSPIGNTDRNLLKAKIDAIRPNDGTPLGEAIKLAADALMAERKKQNNQGTYQLLIVTDGQATDSDLMETYAPEVVKRGILLDVIGIGMAERHTLATIAQRYWTANDAITLDKALKTAVQVETANTDATQADYALLEGLPNDVARAWLTDVTNMDLANWPIGEAKPELAQAAGAQAQNRDQNGASAPTGQAAAQPPAQEESGSHVLIWIIGILFACLAVGRLVVWLLDNC